MPTRNVERATAGGVAASAAGCGARSIPAKARMAAAIRRSHDPQRDLRTQSWLHRRANKRRVEPAIRRLARRIRATAGGQIHDHHNLRLAGRRECPQTSHESGWNLCLQRFPFCRLPARLPGSPGRAMPKLAES